MYLLLILVYYIQNTIILQVVVVIQWIGDWYDRRGLIKEAF